jgi:hypothetical protein
MARWLEWLRRCALFAIATAIGLHYAPMGFLPVDQSICFDGGWRILCGQVPLRDYVAPNGFPVHALQALFFAIFGVNWLAYCLHAALANGAAALLVDRFLALLGLDAKWSSVFALATAFVFTPPFGVPYMDTHAFLFSFAALFAALVAIRGASERGRLIGALCVGPLLALAFLSKQIPSVFFLPAVLLIALESEGERARTLLRMLAGFAASAGILLILAGVLGVDWELVRLHVFDLPSEEGAKRLAFVPTLASLGERFSETRAELGLATPVLTLVGSAIVLLSLPLWRLRPRCTLRRSRSLLALCLPHVHCVDEQPEGDRSAASLRECRELRGSLQLRRHGAARARPTSLGARAERARAFPRCGSFVRRCALHARVRSHASRQRSSLRPRNRGARNNQPARRTVDAPMERSQARQLHAERPEGARRVLARARRRPVAPR